MKVAKLTMEMKLAVFKLAEMLVLLGKTAMSVYHFRAASDVITRKLSSFSYFVPTMTSVL